jgi:hypothetical protein
VQKYPNEESIHQFPFSVFQPFFPGVINLLYIDLGGALPMEHNSKWSSILVPRHLREELHEIKYRDEAYHTFISRLLNNYRKLQRQNDELRARLEGQPPLEQVMRERLPTLPEAKEYVEVPAT